MKQKIPRTVSTDLPTIWMSTNMTLTQVPIAISISDTLITNTPPKFLIASHPQSHPTSLKPSLNPQKDPYKNFLTPRMRIQISTKEAFHLSPSKLNNRLLFIMAAKTFKPHPEAPSNMLPKANTNPKPQPLPLREKLLRKSKKE